MHGYVRFQVGAFQVTNYANLVNYITFLAIYSPIHISAPRGQGKLVVFNIMIRTITDVLYALLECVMSIYSITNSIALFWLLTSNEILRNANDIHFIPCNMHGFDNQPLVIVLAWIYDS